LPQQKKNLVLKRCTIADQDTILGYLLVLWPHPPPPPPYPPHCVPHYFTSHGILIFFVLFFKAGRKEFGGGKMRDEKKKREREREREREKERGRVSENKEVKCVCV